MQKSVLGATIRIRPLEWHNLKALEFIYARRLRHGKVSFKVGAMIEFFAREVAG
jgi:hypothetical protein